MKPAVAKVVNPLGTVVNIQSDDDTDVEICEEIIIHENCDEALFRPVVAPKAILYHENPKQYSDNVITKSLESTTEVAVKILNKNCDLTKLEQAKLKSSESSPKHVSKKTKESHKNKGDKTILVSSDQECVLPKSVKTKSKSESKVKIDISDPFIDIPDFKPVIASKSLKEAAKIAVPKPLERIDLSLADDNKDFGFTLSQLDNDFFSLENVSKVDKIGDTKDCNESLIPFLKTEQKKSDIKFNKCKYSGIDDSSDTTNNSEENTEEKSVSKKSRKPRTKLGIKIININKDSSDSEKTVEDCSTEITLPAPKKSWRSVVGSKPVVEKSLIDSPEKEKDLSLNFAKIEYLEEVPQKGELPKELRSPYGMSDLIDINTPQEEKTKENVNKDLNDLDDINMLRIDKSSDDEKCDSSSSPADVIESDDSGKIPNTETSIFKGLTETKTVTTSKSSRRKKRKK